jgi:hypothetical protein
LAETGGAMPAAAVAAAPAAALASRVEAGVAALRAGRPFEDIAKANGADVETQAKSPIEVPRGRAGSPEERFLQSAEDHACSEPIPQVGGGYRFLYLIERVDPGRRTLANPDVADRYRESVSLLRAQKWRAVYDLRALDCSTVKPERVREELRAEFLGELKDAEVRLRALGLH